MWSLFAALFSVFFVLALAKTGSFYESALVTAWLSPLILLSCYFGTRNPRVAPTTTERIAAKIWLFTRRAFCFIGALLFGAAGTLGGYEVITQGSGGAFVGSIMAFALAAACVWWGIYGAGLQRSFRDDKPTHEKRKRRYGWD